MFIYIKIWRETIPGAHKKRTPNKSRFYQKFMCQTKTNASFGKPRPIELPTKKSILINQIFFSILISKFGDNSGSFHLGVCSWWAPGMHMYVHRIYFSDPFQIARDVMEFSTLNDSYMDMQTSTSHYNWITLDNTTYSNII